MSLELKIAALDFSGTLTEAKDVYAWLIEGASATDAAKPSKRQTAAKTADEIKAEEADKFKEAANAQAPGPEPVVTLDYAKDVQPVVLKAGAANRDATIKAIAAFGVDHANKVPPEKRGELVAACNAILEAASVG